MREGGRVEGRGIQSVYKRRKKRENDRGGKGVI